MEMRPGHGGALGAIIVLAVLATAGYTAYAGATVYRQLDSGRQELVAAQGSMGAAARSADPAQLQAAADQLRRAEADFSAAGRRSQDDPALRLAGGISEAGRQLDAITHLAAIGTDLSRAGEAATAVAIQVATLKQQYAGHALTPDDLQAVLQRTEAIASTYRTSTEAIGQRLRAAHAERAQVTTTGLVAPLRDAYDEADRALADADTAFLRYQDVRAVLSDFLGIQLPA
jgi:hypothetical protein